MSRSFEPDGSRLGKMTTEVVRNGVAQLDDGQEIEVFNIWEPTVAAGTCVIVSPITVKDKEEWVITAANCGLEIGIFEHACFHCDKIAIFVNRKEVTQPCEHQKARMEKQAKTETWRDREPLL